MCEDLCIICGEPVANRTTNFCSFCTISMPSEIKMLALGSPFPMKCRIGREVLDFSKSTWYLHPIVVERLAFLHRTPLLRMPLEQDFIGPLKLTFTVKFEFYNGEVLEIPSPGSGWRPDEIGSYDWPYVHVGGNIQQDSDKCWRVEISSRRDRTFFEVWHKEGQMFLHDWAGRILEEEARIVSWASWKWVGIEQS